MRQPAPFARAHLNILHLSLFVCVLLLPQFASATVIYLTSGSSWTVPSDWNSSNNTIELYGGGGGGGGGYSDGDYNGSGGGGGGGGYSRISNASLTPGSSIPYFVGGGGAGGAGGGIGNPPGGLGSTPGDNGGDTYFNGWSAGGGQGGNSTYAGGGGSGNVFYGGNGGSGDEGGYTGGGGGGGAAGPSGGGGQGGAGWDTGYGAGGNGGGGGGGGGYAGAGGSGQPIIVSSGNIPGAGGCGGVVGDPAPSGGSYGGGGGGGAASANCVNVGGGGNGAPGLIIITYAPAPPAPTCQVSLSPNPSAYSYTGAPVTLSWSSSNADEVYINNIGWLGTSGATYVASQASTDYSCIGYSAAYGYGAWYSASLTVNPPPSPTLGISANPPSSIQTGQTSTITATYAPGSGDSEQDTALNEVPPGGGEFTIPGYGYTPVSQYTYAFSTMTPGTYTFKPYIITSYYTSWSTEGQSVNVTVTQPPTSCTLSASPSSITQGGSSTLTWSSANATSCTGTNFSTSGATSGSTSVSPAQTTTYTGSCTGAGGTSACNAGSGQTVTVTCTESWSCSGETIVQTNPNCSTTNLTTCGANDSFCQNGSNQCLYPVISPNPSGSYTGQLQLIPSLVSPNESTQVHWNVSNAQYCTVTGTNGDSWTGLSSPTGGETSKPITTQTTYTLSCTAYGNNPPVKESETVNITPAYREL